MGWALCHPRGYWSCGFQSQFRPRCPACMAGQLCSQCYHCHHFSWVQGSRAALDGLPALLIFPSWQKLLRASCPHLLVAGKLRHSTMPCWGVTPSSGSGALRTLLDPERMTPEHRSPSSPSLPGKMRLPLPGKGTGCPKVTQTQFPLLPLGKALPACFPAHGSPRPCCPPLFSAPVHGSYM